MVTPGNHRELCDVIRQAVSDYADAIGRLKSASLLVRMAAASAGADLATLEERHRRAVGALLVIQAVRP